MLVIGAIVGKTLAPYVVSDRLRRGGSTRDFGTSASVWGMRCAHEAHIVSGTFGHESTAV